MLVTDSLDDTDTPGMTIELLVEIRELLSKETLSRARLVQSETGEQFESVLTRLGLISEQALAEALSEHLSIPIALPADFPQQTTDIFALPVRFMRDSKILPLHQTSSSIDVAIVNPLNPFPVKAVALATGLAVRQHVARASDIESAIDRLYGSSSADMTVLDEEIDELDLERMKDLTSDAPVIRAVNRLITRAVEQRASDIHIEPTEESVVIRFRVDGTLHDQDSLPATMKMPLVSRIKVMAGLNISERRLPQDGRLRLAVRGHDIDLRVATGPTIHGEAVVMRILDCSGLSLSFDHLGFSMPLQDRFKAILKRPHGIMLVTGPTGSGKTTTLYTALSSLNTPNSKILTIEDPIEYRLSGINQTQVHTGIGLNFAVALRSFLRQDPDIIMVGEIRDLETAQVAVQAALTGHEILSTLHTNSAASAVTRLLDMGVEPFLITSTLNAVLAQRLVRRLCHSCKTQVPIDAETIAVFEAMALDLTGKYAFRAVGCSSCGGSGYHGRIALLELLVMNDTIAKLVLHQGEVREIQAAAIAAGMQTMLQDGLEKAQSGQTTLDEVLRVTRES